MSLSGVDTQSTEVRQGPVESDDDTGRAGAGESTAAAAMRAWALIFLASLTVMIYHFLFQFTKPSPLSTAAGVDLLPVLSFAVLIAGMIAVLGLPVAILGDALSRRLFGRRQLGVGTVAVTASLYFLGVLAFLENFLYTLEGVGLKTEESILLRLVFGVLRVSVATLGARQVARMSGRGVRITALLM